MVRHIYMRSTCDAMTRSNEKTSSLPGASIRIATTYQARFMHM